MSSSLLRAMRYAKFAAKMILPWMSLSRSLITWTCWGLKRAVDSVAVATLVFSVRRPQLSFPNPGDLFRNLARVLREIAQFLLVLLGIDSTPAEVRLRVRLAPFWLPTGADCRV
jgi:hypothetical protein